MSDKQRKLGIIAGGGTIPKLLIDHCQGKSRIVQYHIDDCLKGKDTHRTEQVDTHLIGCHQHEQKLFHFYNDRQPYEH